MSNIQEMPPIKVDEIELKEFGKKWIENKGALSRTSPYSSSQLGEFFDSAVGEALAILLGGYL